jgi:poly(A) polymerase
MVNKPEFANAMAYLRLGAETKMENRTPLEWWDAFLLEPSSETYSEPPTSDAPPKKRRKRRRRHRPAPKNPA